MQETRSWDTETGGLDWFEPDQRAFLTTWSDARGNDHLAHQDNARAMAAFKSDMQRSDVIAAHNLPFDVHQTRESANGFDMLKLGKRLVDTVLLAKVAVPERRFAEGDLNGFRLDELSRTYLPATEQKLSLAERAKELKITLNKKGGYHALWQADPEFLEEYAKRDTRATLGLLQPLEAKLTDKTRVIWDLEQQCQPHLIRAEARGVAVDQAKVEPLRAKYLEKRDAAHAAVIAALGPDALGDPDNPDSKDEPAKLLDALLSAGVPLHRTTPSGETLSTDHRALQEFTHDFPFIQSLFDYRQAAKFLRTYIEPMLGREVVHTNYNQLGAWTGRMSSSRPNMQNIPVRGEGSSELREMFVPRPGYCFIVSDFDQIELRLLAYYLNNQQFIDRIESGDDVFSELAAELAPIRGYDEEFGTDPADYRKGTPGGTRWRPDAKNGTYGICYGIGAAKFSNAYGLPPGPPLGPTAWKVRMGYAQPTDPSYPVGTAVIKKVKGWLPGYWDLMSTNKRDPGRVIQKIWAVGHVNTIMGRRQPISADRAYVALAALIQGGAGEIFKRGVCLVGDALAPYGGLPIMFVHDEVVSEVPIEHADACLAAQDQAMMAAYDLRPRLSVSGTIAYNNYAEGK